MLWKEFASRIVHLWFAFVDVKCTDLSNVASFCSLSVLFLAAAVSPKYRITGFQVNRFVSLHNLYESCGMHTEKGRSTPPPSTSTALTQTPSSYLSTVAFLDRTVWPLPGTIGCVEQQAGLWFRLLHGWGEQLPLTIKWAGALIKTGRGVSCGGTVTEQDYPDPRVRIVCHPGSISWQQHENEGDLFTAGPWPEEGVGAAGSRLRLCAPLSL